VSRFSPPAKKKIIPVQRKTMHAVTPSRENPESRKMLISSFVPCLPPLGALPTVEGGSTWKKKIVKVFSRSSFSLDSKREEFDSG
jgi:hypothetical protein